MFAFIRKYEKLSDTLMDKKLASLGDAYVNFLYSLALSKKKGEPVGTKVKGRLLADAFKKAGLRKLLPSRINRHKQADAAEALIVYAWMRGSVSLEEELQILEENENEIEAFRILLLTAKKNLEM